MPKISDVLLRKLATPNKMKVIYDTSTTGLCLVQRPSGRNTWCLHLAFPGFKRQTLRVLGAFPTMTLPEARQKAAAWYDLVKAGTDPTEHERQAAEAAVKAKALAQANTLASVVEAYAARVLARQRQGAAVHRRLLVEVIPFLGSKPVADITRGDIIAVIERVMDRTETGARARNVLADLRGVFNFVTDRPDAYGLDHAPTDRIKPARLTGRKVPRQRVLTDDELRKLWTATGEVGFPYGSMVRLIALTGCRVSELRLARWREIDMAARAFTVPASRFKSNRQHVVPLSSATLALLASVPRGSRGDDGYVFSNSEGARPISRDKAVRALNEVLGGVPGWTLHDIRRTVRTRLTPLTTYETAEAVIGHAKTGLNAIYNQHGYASEKAAALQAWADTLLTIVEPPSDNGTVVRLHCA